MRRICHFFPTPFLLVPQHSMRFAHDFHNRKKLYDCCVRKAMQSALPITTDVIQSTINDFPIKAPYQNKLAKFIYQLSQYAVHEPLSVRDKQSLSQWVCFSIAHLINCLDEQSSQDENEKVIFKNCVMTIWALMKMSERKDVDKKMIAHLFPFFLFLVEKMKCASEKINNAQLKAVPNEQELANTIYAVGLFYFHYPDEELRFTGARLIELFSECFDLTTVKQSHLQQILQAAAMLDIAAPKIMIDSVSALKPISSRTQLLVAEQLREHGFEVVVEAFVLNAFFVDILLIDCNKVIEIDGLHHASFEQQQKDKRRDAFLQKHGFEVYRFSVDGLSASQVAKAVITLLTSNDNNLKM